MVVITFKNGVTHIYNSDSPRLIPLWKRVEEISSVVYGLYMDAKPIAPAEAPKPIAPAEPPAEPPIAPAEAPIPPAPIGDFISRHRHLKGYKQSELRWALNHDLACTLHRKADTHYALNFISRVENGHIAPSEPEFRCLATKLGIDSLDGTLVKRWYDSEGKYKH